MTIRHTRRDPVVNAFTYGSYHWLIDVDAPPALPDRCGRWPASTSADHGDGRRARACAPSIDAFLALHGVDLDGGTVTMLTTLACSATCSTR